MLIVMGDWNAKIGKKEDPGISSKWGLDERNERGEKLISFCAENELIIINTTRSKIIYIDI